MNTSNPDKNLDYPRQYEMSVITTGGIEVFIRPIKPEDAPLLEELFNTLSPRSIYYRFFSFMKVLPPKMLSYFTHIDYDRDMALVALEKTQNGERILGVSRYFSLPDLEEAEFAIAVGDPWQGKGVGGKLLECLISIAKERGLQTLTGSVLGVNTTMLSLARSKGATRKLIPGGGEYEIRLDLSSIEIEEENRIEGGNYLQSVKISDSTIQ